MTIADKLDKDIPLLIEGGEKAKSVNAALHLDELLEKQDFEIVEPDQPVGANGTTY